MKKIITGIVVICVFIASVSAVDFSVGTFGNFNVGLGTDFSSNQKDGLEDLKEKLIDSGLNVSDKKLPLVGGGFGIYANFGLFEAGKSVLGIQPEIDFNFRNGLKYTLKYSTSSVSEEVKVSLFNHTMDIPVFLTYKETFKSVRLGLGIGPYISIPLYGEQIVTDYAGAETTQYVDGKEHNGVKVTFDGINFGFGFDANFGYKLGKGFINVDARYFLDLSPTKIKVTQGSISETQEYIYRRMLSFSLGYEYKFSF